MRLQDAEYTCGPVALANCLEALGYDFTVGALARLCKTTPTNGTYEDDVIRALVKLDYPVRVLEESHPGFALVTLRGFVSYGAAAMLAVDNDGHWVSVVGTCGSRFILHDPADGVTSYSDKELIERWRKDKSKAPFYGLVVLGRK